MIFPFSEEHREISVVEEKEDFLKAFETQNNCISIITLSQNFHIF